MSADLKSLRSEAEKRTPVVIHGARRPKATVYEWNGAWFARVDFFMAALEPGNVLDVNFDSGEFTGADPRAAIETMFAALPDVYAESRAAKLAAIDARLRREAAELRERAVAREREADRIKEGRET